MDESLSLDAGSALSELAGMLLSTTSLEELLTAVVELAV
jgi:hypothetical protein